MFSAMVRMRPACARKPDAAISIDLMKSISAAPYSCARAFRKVGASPFAYRGLHEAKTAGVERGRGLIVHLVTGDLEHLVFEIHRIAAGPDAALGAEFGDELRAASCPHARHVPGIGHIHRERGDARGVVEFRRGEIARTEMRRVGVGDV